MNPRFPDIKSITDKFNHPPQPKPFGTKEVAPQENMQVHALFKLNPALADAVYEIFGLSPWDKDKIYDTTKAEPLNEGDFFGYISKHRNDGSTITVYAATNDIESLLSNGYSGQHTGLGTTKGEAQGTVFLTPFFIFALDYANQYSAEGDDKSKISVVEVTIKNGAGTVEGHELRARKEDIISVKESQVAKLNREMLEKEILQKKQKAEEKYAEYLQTTTKKTNVSLEENISGFREYISKGNRS